MLVAPSGYTRAARELEKETHQLDLVSYSDLNLLLNEQFGAEWPRLIDYRITWIKRLENDAAGDYLKAANDDQ